MQSLKRSNIMAIYFIAGVLAGLFVLLFAYALLFALAGRSFTFPLLAELHRNEPALYLLDLLPVLTALGGYFLAHREVRLQQQTDMFREQAASSDRQVASLIRDLAAGKTHDEMSMDRVDEDLVASLSALQKKLKADREEAIVAKAADEKHRWTSDGLAAFGDLLRANTADEEKLGYAVVAQLVRYLEINQGGFFVARNTGEERYLEMIACHAYGRKKFPERKLAWGEGLIGAVAIEMESFYTDRIPENYLTITSGLGRANPRYLLLVPMFLSKEVYGVIELASFHEFPEHQIRFVERVAENAATTLNNMYNTLRTEALLRETQEQAAKLAKQEKEHRKHMEELQSTQAEATRQSDQFVGFTKTVNETLIRAEYTTDGTLVYANTRFLRELGYAGNQEVEGKNIDVFIHASDRDWFKAMWEELSGGSPHFEGYMRHVTKLGQELWTMATYSGLRNEDGAIARILFLAIDATSQKEESLRYETKITALDRILPQAEFSTDGKILSANTLFGELLFGPDGMFHLTSIFDSVPLREQERFIEMWEQCVAGESFSGQLRMLDASGEEKWFLGHLSPVADTYGEVNRIVFLGIDNSREKELEISLRDRNEQIRETEQQMRMQTLDMENQAGEFQEQRARERKEMQKETARYADILELSPIPVIAINNQGFVVMFNHAAEKYFKRKKRTVLKQPGDHLFGHEQTDPVIQAFYQPGKEVIETDHTEVSMRLSDQQIRKGFVSVFETKSGKERIYTLFIHK